MDASYQNKPGMIMANKAASKRKDNSPFAANLKKLLAERGITQKQAASLAGVSTSVLNDWVGGRTPQDLTAVAVLAKALKTDFQWLLTGICAEHSPITEATLPEIFDIEDDSSFSGIFLIEAKRLKRKNSGLSTIEINK